MLSARDDLSNHAAEQLQKAMVRINEELDLKELVAMWGMEWEGFGFIPNRCKEFIALATGPPLCMNCISNINEGRMSSRFQ